MLDSAERMQNTGMRKLTEQELRFQIKRAVQGIPAGVTQRLHRVGRDQQALAIDEMTDLIFARMSRFEVYGPDPIGNHG